MLESACILLRSSVVPGLSISNSISLPNRSLIFLIKKTLPSGPTLIRSPTLNPSGSLTPLEVATLIRGLIGSSNLLFAISKNTPDTSVKVNANPSVSAVVSSKSGIVIFTWSPPLPTSSRLSDTSTYNQCNTTKPNNRL